MTKSCLDMRHRCRNLSLMSCYFARSTEMERETTSETNGIENLLLLTETEKSIWNQMKDEETGIQRKVFLEITKRLMSQGSQVPHEAVQTVL